MRTVRIYQPLQNPMQGGVRKKKRWILRLDPQSPLYITRPLGWLGTRDTDQELCLSFPSLLKAIEYAKTHGFSYSVVNSPQEKPIFKSYGDNFINPRLGN